MPSEVRLQIEHPNHLYTQFLLSLIFILSAFSIHFFFTQSDFFAVFPIYTLAFLSLLGLYFAECSVSWVVGIGVIIRLALIFLFPGFSDDIYRFYWDGRLILSGMSPYGILPSDILPIKIPFLNHELFDQLNSQYYYTVYPPVNQLYFAVGTLAGSITNAAVVMKLLVFLTELVGLYFMVKIMKKWNLNPQLVIFYFLNPLVISEGIGNLHFEVVMLCLLCISIYYIFNKNIIKGAFFLSLSIGVKLLPLMLLPYFLFRMKGRERILFFCSGLLFLIFIFLPLWYSVDIGSFFQSVDLYFRKFEFNAGIYYILRYMGNLISGYNQISFIGPILAFVTLFLNLKLATSSDNYAIKDFFRYALLVWTIYLLLATTVHPWYVLSLVFFATFSGMKYPFVWSFLVFISYVNYSYDPYFENLWFIAFEYSLLSVFIFWEYKKHYKDGSVNRVLSQQSIAESS